MFCPDSEFQWLTLFLFHQGFMESNMALISLCGQEEPELLIPQPLPACLPSHPLSEVQGMEARASRILDKQSAN